jgi:hypothetical protein
VLARSIFRRGFAPYGWNQICCSAINFIKANTTVPAFVEEIVKPCVPGVSEKAQIAIQGADYYYRQIRIENSLTAGKLRLVGRIDFCE